MTDIIVFQSGVFTLDRRLFILDKYRAMNIEYRFIKPFRRSSTKKSGLHIEPIRMKMISKMMYCTYYRLRGLPESRFDTNTVN